jgi:hypothetical protein
MVVFRPGGIGFNEESFSNSPVDSASLEAIVVVFCWESVCFIGIFYMSDPVSQLSDFDPAVRQQALQALLAEVESGARSLPESGDTFNMHAHTFYSYNPDSYSPTHYAWLARERGLIAAGIVDFDVLDGLEEMLAAGKALGLKRCVSLESRVYVPEFSTRVINSPGEPGISYHMGVGFTSSTVTGWAGEFLAEMRTRADQRNRALVDRVNAHTTPVTLDYDADVVPLVPKGNATERHLCEAFARKAAEHFDSAQGLIDYWSDKLGLSVEELEALDLPTGAKLQGQIRAKTMKRGGVGYVQPGEGAFPTMADMNRFVLDAGAIPTLTWLNGLSDGEGAVDELIQTCVDHGAAAVNIIPDRNFTYGVKDEKLANLHDMVKRSDELYLPVIVGTEMNSPGLRFVDDFACEEMAPLHASFTRGMQIAYAHTVLQLTAGLGYLSEWAASHFDDVAAKYDFYNQVGRDLTPANEDRLAGITDDSQPSAIIDRVRA